jgi:hypothetical protein
VNDDRTGVSKELTVPMAAASTNSPPIWMLSVATSTASTAASTPASTWVVWSMCHRLWRSDRAPAKAPKNSTGRNCAAVTSPSRLPLPVSSMTSQPMATVCIHVPDCEMVWPTR